MRRADAVDLGQVVNAGGSDVVNAGVAAGEQFGHLRADVQDAECEEDAGQGALLAGLDVGEDAGGELVAHAVQLNQLLSGEAIDVGDVGHQAAVDEDAAPALAQAVPCPLRPG